MPNSKVLVKETTKDCTTYLRSTYSKCVYNVCNKNKSLSIVTLRITPKKTHPHAVTIWILDRNRKAGENEYVAITRAGTGTLTR